MILGVLALIGITLTGGEQESASARMLREADESFRARKYPEALDAYLKAREYHHATGGPLQKMIADWAVGHGYRLAGNFGEAERRLRKTLPLAVEGYAKDRRPESAEWVGWCKKDLGETLLARGEKAQALDLLRQARASLVEAGIDKSWPEGLKPLDEALEKNR